VFSPPSPTLFSRLRSEVEMLMIVNALERYLNTFKIPSLKQCLTMPSHFAEFKAFATTLHATENVDFVAEILRLESFKSSAEMDKACRDLYDKFVGEGADIQLNLGSRSMKRINACMESGELLTAKAFLPAKNECLKLLALDIYPAYIDTKFTSPVASPRI